MFSYVIVDIAKENIYFKNWKNKLKNKKKISLKKKNKKWKKLKQLCKKK